MQKLNIFMDTNIIKCIEPNLLQFSFNETYKKLKEFIDENEYKKIHIVIPKIVIEELIKQYIEEYRYKYENLDSKVDVLLNDCSKIGWDIKINKKNNMSVSKYEKYIRKKANEYIKKEKMNIIELNKENFYNIINRSINKKLPFFSGKGTIEINGDRESGKEFSDAGFKDVIFLETIIQFNKLKRSKALILTKDNILLQKLNWKEEIKRDNIVVKGIDQGKDLIKYICNTEGIKDFTEYRKFCKEDYFKELIYNAINKKFIRIIEIQEENEEELNYVDIISWVKGDSEKEKVIIRLNDERDPIEILNENSEVIYEW